MLTMQRAHAPAKARPVARAVGAVPRIEHEARRGRVHVQAVRESCGEQDGFGPDRDKGGLFRAMSTASAPAMRPPALGSSTTG